MPAQSSAARRSRQSHLSDDDVVLARALEFAQWARRNIRIIVAVAIVVVIALGGLIYYRMYRADRESRAAAEFITLQQTASSGNTALAERDLQRFIGRYEGTMYGDEAQVMLGEIELQAGQPQKAIDAVQGLADRVGKSSLATQAAMLLGDAQQAAGQRDAAIATYLEVGDKAQESFRREEALQTAAILRREAGDLAGAAELYRRLIDATDEDSGQRSIYEMRLAEVEAAAQAK